MNRKTNRRSFLVESSAVAGAAAPMIVSSRALGNAENAAANERFSVGVIGLGSRGYNLVDAFLARSDVQITAICDVDQHHHRDREWGKGLAYGLLPGKAKIEKAYAKMSNRAKNTKVGLRTFSDFRELVALKDIDAVVVATPDHWHALCTLTALRAGKDVYCEKPVTHLFAEGRLIHQEVAKQNAVFQTGSQQRSDAKFRRAVELVRNGVLGKITKVEVGLPPGYDKPMGDSKVSHVPKQQDYDFWCGPSPRLPYVRARNHRWWRGHRAYGGGVLMDWIGHHNDIAHWALDLDRSGPESIEATEWILPDTDVYDTPHQYTIRCTFPGGAESTISSRNKTGLKLIGENGWVFVNRGILETSTKEWANDKFDPGDIDVYRSDDHVGNFVDSLRSRIPCIAPAETAHRSITPGHVGYVSAALKRKINWDAQKQEAVNDSEANELLNAVDYRQSWSLG